MQKKNETNEKNPMSFIQKKIPIDITQLKTILNPNNNHGVCGSINLGNTCYMNSSIACLSNCTELTTFFLSKDYKNFKNTSNKNGLNGKLAEEWYSLLKDYWKSNKTHGNPKNIKNLVAKKDKKFEDFEQQDANEFIFIFLEILSEDLNLAKKQKYLEMEEQQNEEKDIQGAQRFWEFHYSRNNSIITDLFNGLNKSTITCPICKYKSITYIPFSSLSLLIPNSNQLKKIRYENFNLIDISIYYIPIFSLAKSYKINIRIDKNSKYKDVINQINEKINEFPFEINETGVDIISVKNKLIDEVISLDSQIDNKTYNNSIKFIVQKEKINGKKSFLIPIYIKLGNKISSYPRGIYAYEGMSYGELKKKLYVIIRKYIYCPIKKRPEAKQLNINSKIKTINTDYVYTDLNELPMSIEKEYDILNSLELERKIKYPYKIFIQKNVTISDSTMIFEGEKDLFENLSNYEITMNESQIDLLAYYLKDLQFILLIQIDDKSDRIRNSICEEIDKCVVLQSSDYCNNDFLYKNDNNGNNITIDDCFHLFNMEEQLESGNEWFCKMCKNKVNAIKKLEFFYLPKIFCICLSRFKKVGDDYRKNEKYIDFPLIDLNMDKYIIAKSELSYIYDIFAVCEHFGSRYGGHYTAICKNYDGKWYSYDDSNCSEAEEKEVCSKNAYVLFYRRRYW